MISKRKLKKLRKVAAGQNQDCPTCKVGWIAVDPTTGDRYCPICRYDETEKQHG